MTAIFTGLGAGLVRSSATALGSSGLLGSASTGRGGDGLMVNAATGNLVVTRQDEFLSGRGLDLGISRTYNGLGEVSDATDDNRWQMSAARRLYGLTGTLNQAGSTIKRVSGDGSVVTYTYRTLGGVDAYWSTDGDGAHDKLVRVGAYWTWTEGSSQLAERYEADPAASGQWRIVSQKDRDGYGLTFSYDASNRLERVTTANDGAVNLVTGSEKSYLRYTYDASNNVTAIVTGYTDHGYDVENDAEGRADDVDRELTRTTYAYDAQNRLTGVTVDLSPEAAGTSDGDVYTLSYAYDASGRLSEVGQIDGSRTVIAYDGQGRVLSLTEYATASETRVTQFEYLAPSGSTRATKVTAPNGLVTTLTSDINTGMLRSITAPPAYTGAPAQVQTFEYDPLDGDSLKKATAPDGTETNYSYDTMGNLTLIDRPLGSDTQRWYDATNLLIKELSYGSNENYDETTHYTRYVYDDHGHLRYRISAGGIVTEFRQDQYGLEKWEVTYTADTYDLGSSSTVPTLAEMDGWRDTQADLSKRTFVYQMYDARGNLTYVTRYTAATSVGAHDPLGGVSRTYYAYDQAGRLLSRYDLDEGVRETFAYDGLGRLIASSDGTGGVTTVFFDDANTRTVVQMSSGLVRTSTYNKAGDLLGQIDSALGLTTANLAPAVTGWASNAASAPLAQTAATMDGGAAGTLFAYSAAGNRNYLRAGAGSTVAAGETVRVRITIRGDGTTTSHLVGLHGTVSGWGNLDATDATDDTDAQAIVVDGPGRLVRIAGGQWQVDGISATKDTTIEIVRTYTVAETARAYLYVGASSPATVGAGVIVGAVSLVKTTADAALAFSAATDNRYDALGRLRVTGDQFDALARSWIVYDNAGRRTGVVSRMTDLEGAVKYTLTEYVYDANNRVIGTIVYARSVSASLIGVLDDTGNTLENPNNTLTIAQLRPTADSGELYDIREWTLYDANGQVVQRINREGEVTQYAYDGMGRVVRTTLFATRVAAAASWTAASPPAGPVTVTADPDHDAVTRTFYSRNGQVRGVLDGEGYLTEFVYDAAGRKIREVAYASGIAADHPTVNRATATFIAIRGVVAAGGDRRTHYVYDGQGLLRYQIDGLGTVTGYTYNRAQQLTATTRYSTRVAVADTGYDLATLAVTVNAATDRTVSNVYDSAGRLSYTQDAVGTRTYLFYDAAGNVVRTQVGTDGSQRVTRNWYDARGALRFSVDPEGYLTRYTYTTGGLVSAELVYDARVSTAPLTVTDATPIEDIAAAAAALEAAAAADGDPATTGYTRTAYQYDEMGRVILEFRGDGTNGVLATSYHYRTDGQLSYRDDGYPGGVDTTGDVSRTWYTYDRAGRVIGTQRARGTPEATLTSYTYDAFGNLDTVTDGRGVVTDYAYDRLGRATSSLTTGLGQTHPGYAYAYNAYGEVVQATDPAGNSTYTYYDRLGRVIAVRDAENYVTGTTYNTLGDVASVTRRYTQVTASFDPVALETPQASDAVTRFEYDRRGLVTKVTDALGFFETYHYDAYGNRDWATAKSAAAMPGSGIAVEGGKTFYTYDKRGLLLSETLPITSFKNGEVVAVSNTYAYDARGNMVTRTEAAGSDEQRVTTYRYDSAGRLWKTIGEARGVLLTSDAAATTSFTPTEELFYDRRGNLAKTIDAAGGVRRFYYDDLDRKTGEIDPLGTYTAYTYDANGNVTSIRVYQTRVQDSGASVSANGGSDNLLAALQTALAATEYRETTFAYDALGRLTRSSVNAVETRTWSGTAWVVATATLDTSYQYDANGNVVLTTDPNGNLIYSYYDKLGRKTAQVDAGKYLTTWTYDAEGNVLTETRFADKLGTDVALAPTVTTSLAALIASAGYNALDDRVTAYTYDKVGNRTSEARQNVRIYDTDGLAGSDDDPYIDTVTSTIAYTYNGLGQVLRRTEAGATADYVDYTYDAAGRLVEEKRKSYTGHTGAAVTPEVDYSYDGLGNLVRTVAAGAAGVAARTTSYTYGTGGLLASTTDAGGYTHTYRYDKLGRLVRDEYVRTRADGTSVTEAALTSYDALGRTVEQTVATKSGSTWSKGDIAATEYTAFGEVYRTGINGLWQTTNLYDKAGRLWKSNAGDGVWKLFAYDKNGNQTLAITSAGYDLAGLTLAQAVARIGQTDVNATYTVYSARNLATSVTEEGRQLSGTTAQDLTSSRTWNAFGETLSETNAAGAVTGYTYNTMGRLTRSEGPTVKMTLENGTSLWIRPSQDNYYDAAGRLVATRDANGDYGTGGTEANGASKAANTGNLTRLTLLSGTGYGGSQALVTLETHADDGTVATKYDIHGDARTIVQSVGDGTFLTTQQSFDGLGRLAQVIRPGGLVESYGYDIHGQQITHGNSLLDLADPTNKETTTYDAQGRVISTRAFGGDVTGTSYVWDAAIGGVGGWLISTTMANTRVAAVKSDIFGRTHYKDDLDIVANGGVGHIFTFTYDPAGRMTGRSGNGETVTYSWLNNGQLGTITSVQGGVTTSQVSTYDKMGNKLTEVQTRGTTTIQNASATYDALNRLLTWNELGNTTTTPVSDTAYTYDANSNVRSTLSHYRRLDDDGTFATTDTPRNQWYRYDVMNRMVQAEGSYTGTAGSGGHIVEGSGTVITYDDLGRRHTVATHSDSLLWTGWRATEPGTQNTVYHDDPSELEWGGYNWVKAGRVTYAGDVIETYTYTADGQIDEVWVSAQKATANGGMGVTVTGTMGPSVKRSKFTYDTMGRVTSQSDFDGTGAVAYSRTQIVYDGAGRILSETQTVKQVATDSAVTTLMVSEITNTYGDGLSYALGAVVTSSADVSVDEDDDLANDTITRNYYDWYDGAVLQKIVYDKDTDSSNNLFDTRHTLTATGVVSFADIDDDRDRDVTFLLDVYGQVLRRQEEDENDDAGDPLAVWYRFNGREMGHLTNDGTGYDDYASSIGDRQTKSIPGDGAFQFGATTGRSTASFGEAYEAVNSFNQGSAGSSYTVQAGDTLEGIASQLYGDSALWYRIAGANGLSAGAVLVQGQLLSLPTGVSRSSNTASTFKPYDPAEALGDTSPTTVKPKGNKCGSFGMIMLAVVAIAVATIATAGAASLMSGATFSSTLGAMLGGAATVTAAGTTVAVGASTWAAAGAIGGALGSMASQGLGVATGMQQDFSWKNVALAGVAGGIGGYFQGLGNVARAAKSATEAAEKLGGIGNFLAGGGFASTVARGVITNAATQGIGRLTGLQDKFSWAGLAAAGVGAAAGWGMSDTLGEAASGAAGRLTTNMASSIAMAATRSAITGQSFDDGLRAALPDVIGQAIGGAIAGALVKRASVAEFERDTSPEATALRSFEAATGRKPETAEELATVANLARSYEQARSESSSAESAARLERATNEFLDSVADDPQGRIAVEQLRAELAKARNPGGTPAADLGGEEVLVGATRNYVASSTIDGAAIYVGRVREEVGAQFNEVLEESPGLKLGLEIGNGALTVLGGPMRAGAGLALSYAEDRVTDFVKDAFYDNDWSVQKSQQGATGTVFSGKLLLTGMAAVRLTARPAHVINALRNFEPRTFQAGSNTFRLDRKGMGHILERHHPEYWDGSTKSKQTFFDKRLSIDDIADIAMSGLKQNRDNLVISMRTKQWSFSYGGKSYVMAVRSGRVTQLYPE